MPWSVSRAWPALVATIALAVSKAQARVGFLALSCHTLEATKKCAGMHFNLFFFFLLLLLLFLFACSFARILDCDILSRYDMPHHGRSKGWQSLCWGHAQEYVIILKVAHMLALALGHRRVLGGKGKGKGSEQAREHMQAGRVVAMEAVRRQMR